MERVLRSIDAFATMLQPLDDDLFSELVEEIGRGILEVVALDPPAGVESAAAILRMAERSTGGGHLPLWSPELGHCLTSLRAALKNGGVVEGQVGLAQLALHLAAAGVPGSVTVTFAEPCHLRWRNVALGSMRRLTMQADGTHVEIEIVSDDHTRVVKLPVSEDEAAALLHPHLTRVKAGAFDVILLSGPQCRDLRFPAPTPAGVETISPALPDHLREALAIFANAPEAWRRWYGRVLRAISLGQMPQAGFCSGSIDGYFGLISMTDMSDPLKIAETLVHESAHQYFYALNRLSPIARASGNEYYSPFVRRKRPIDRILMGYHAFANVEFFYQYCLADGHDAARCQAVLALIRRELAMVEPVLTANTDLTPMGRTLFERLAAVRPLHAATTS